jgi:hypothetical protein
MLKGTGGKFCKVATEEKVIQVEKALGIANPHPPPNINSLFTRQLLGQPEINLFTTKTKCHGRN